MLCIIPPHVRKHEQVIIWRVLEGHRLDPEPLEECRQVRLTQEEVTALCVAMESAPIPAFRPDRELYVSIELRSKDPAAPKFLRDALSARLEGTSGVPLWEGGRRRYRDVRIQGHPQAFLREILIVPDSTALPSVRRLLDAAADRETVAAA